jgi:Domain of unknown function (DUF4333)
VHRRRLLFVAPLLVLGMAGCGSGTLSAGTIEEGAEDALEEQVGTRPDITCPEELPAEVGAETECTLTAGDDPAEYPVSVRVSSVEGDTANFDIEVGDAPAG